VAPFKTHLLLPLLGYHFLGRSFGLRCGFGYGGYLSLDCCLRAAPRGLVACHEEQLDGFVVLGAEPNAWPDPVDVLLAINLNGFLGLLELGRSLRPPALAHIAHRSHY